MLRFMLPGLPMLRQALGDQMRLLPAVLVLGLLSATLEGVGVGLVIPLLSIIIGRGDDHGTGGFSTILLRAGSGWDESQSLVAIAAIILMLIVLKNAFAFANTMLINFIYGKASHSIRSALSERLLRVGYPFFLHQSPGRLLNIISNESWRASDAVQTVLATIVSASAAVILLAFLLLLSWKMTLLVALGLALVQLAHATLSSSLKAPSRSLTSRNSGLASRMLHLVHAGRLIRIFGQELREKAAFDAASDGVRRAAFVLQIRQGALPPLTEVLHSLLFLSVVVGAWSAGIDFPVIIAFVVLLYRLQPHMRALQMSWSSAAGLERLPRRGALAPGPDRQAPCSARQPGFPRSAAGHHLREGDLHL